MSNASLDYIDIAINSLKNAKTEFNRGDYQAEEWYVRSAKLDIENALKKITNEIMMKAGYFNK